MRRGVGEGRASSMLSARDLMERVLAPTRKGPGFRGFRGLSEGGGDDNDDDDVSGADSHTCHTRHASGSGTEARRVRNNACEANSSRHASSRLQLHISCCPCGRAIDQELSAAARCPLDLTIYRR